MKPEEVFTGEWSKDEEGFYHLLSGRIRHYDKKVLSKLKTMRATASMWINYDLPSLVEMNNKWDTYIYDNAQLPRLKKPKAKVVAVWLDDWYGCRISRIKDWDSFYSEFRAVNRAVTEEVSFVQTGEGIKLLSPNEFLSFLKLGGI